MRANSLKTNIVQFYQARDLLMTWTARTIRGRYQQSILGWLWALVQPAASVAIFAVVFSFFVPIDTGETPYLIFSYVAMVPWTFFSTAVTDMSNSLVQNMSLVTKIYFPREALPIASMLARLLDFSVASVLFIVLVIIYQTPIKPILLLLFPVVLGVQILFVVGLGLFGAALNVFSRDIDPLLKLGIQLWFYASPIIYPVTLVPEQYRFLYFLNPIAGILESYRDILVYGRLPGDYLVISAVVSIISFLLGYLYFKKVEFQFADIV
jgi:lipopolysaccharide transport system permease protein